jgi:hypothetical protein
MSGVARTLPAMANFALMLVHGPGWDDSRPIREQAAWDGHAAFMDALVDDGFILLGGPLSTGERTLHLVEATSEIGSIEPWTLWLDSRNPGGDVLRSKTPRAGKSVTMPCQVRESIRSSTKKLSIETRFDRVDRSASGSLGRYVALVMQME